MMPGTDSCSVDITTDNAAAEAVAAAEGGECGLLPKPVAHGTRGQVPAPRPRLRTTASLADSARRQRLTFPPATNGYTNVYDGHTQTTEPALGAGCNGGFGNDFPGQLHW